MYKSGQQFLMAFPSSACTHLYVSCEPAGDHVREENSRCMLPKLYGMLHFLTQYTQYTLPSNHPSVPLHLECRIVSSMTPLPNSERLFGPRSDRASGVPNCRRAIGVHLSVAAVCRCCEKKMYILSSFSSTQETILAILTPLNTTS